MAVWRDGARMLLVRLVLIPCGAGSVRGPWPRNCESSSCPTCGCCGGHRDQTGEGLGAGGCSVLGRHGARPAPDFV